MSRPYYQDDAVTIYHGDAQAVPPVIADMFLVDPPYSRAGAAHSGRKATAGVAEDVQGSDQFWLYWFTDIARKLTHHTKATGAGFVFTDYRTVSLVERAFAAAGTGWTVTQCLVWDRESTGMGSPFRASHELIAFVRGPSFKWEGSRSLTNVLRFRWPYGEHENHPAEKPISLLRYLIEVMTDPGQLVLDTFTGSGSALVAARLAGRKAIGIEIEERYCEIAARRCSQEVLGLSA